MKTPILPILLAVVLLSLSCEEDKEEPLYMNERVRTEDPVPPETIIYDFNSDSIDDFRISHGWAQTDGINCSGFAIWGSLVPLNSNSLLRVDSGTITLQKGDTLWRQASAPQYFDEFRASVSSIDDSCGFGWPLEWGVRDDEEPYYLGVLMNEPGYVNVGWLKLVGDKITGEVEVIDYAFTRNNYITVGDLK